MIVFAKLISGEFVVGETDNEGISKIIKVDLVPDNTGKFILNISAYIPFEHKFLPDIEKCKIMCSIPVDEEEHRDLIEHYKSIRNQLHPMSVH